MKLLEIIDLLRSGTLEAVWWMDQQTELARMVLISHDVATYNAEECLASLRAEEGDMAVALLEAMVVYSDSRACLAPDTHRAQWTYDPGWKHVRCDACALVRKEALQVHRVAIEQASLTFREVGPRRTE